MGDDPKLKDLAFKEDRDLFDGETGTNTSYSGKTAEAIDAEVRKIMDQASARASAVLKTNRDALEAIKDALLDKETLDESDIKKLFKNTKLPKEAEL